MVEVQVAIPSFELAAITAFLIAPFIVLFFQLIPVLRVVRERRYIPALERPARSALREGLRRIANALRSDDQKTAVRELSELRQLSALYVPDDAYRPRKPAARNYWCLVLDELSSSMDLETDTNFLLQIRGLNARPKGYFLKAVLPGVERCERAVVNGKKLDVWNCISTLAVLSRVLAANDSSVQRTEVPHIQGFSDDELIVDLQELCRLLREGSAFDLNNANLGLIEEWFNNPARIGRLSDQAYVVLTKAFNITIASREVYQTNGPKSIMKNKALILSDIVASFRARNYRGILDAFAEHVALTVQIAETSRGKQQ